MSAQSSPIETRGLQGPLDPSLGAKELTDEEVGDADSFGRTLKWMGMAVVSITLRHDCTGFPEGGDRCVTLKPAPQFTTFDEQDVDTIMLPGQSAHSLLCHWVSPITSYSLFNPSPAALNSIVRATPTIRFESVVLKDPTLINPLTGQPFGGFIDTELPGAHRNTVLLEPGERTRVLRTDDTRACIGGTIARRNLMGVYGLSSDRVQQIFANPITIHFGIAGSANLMEDDAGIGFGIRFIGD
jgi:hypothetical protein